MATNATNHIMVLIIKWLLLSSSVRIFIPSCLSYLEQLDTSMVGPWQFLPPQRGAGLSQDLERHKQEVMPSTPSSLLQVCHGAHTPKPPLVVWFRSWKANIQWWCQWLIRAFMIFRLFFQKIIEQHVSCNSIHFSQTQSSWHQCNLIHLSPVHVPSLPQYSYILSCLVQNISHYESWMMPTAVTHEWWHQRGTKSSRGPVRRRCDQVFTASFLPDTQWCSASTGSCWSSPPVWCSAAAWSPSHSRGPSPPSTSYRGQEGEEGRKQRGLFVK